MAYFLQWFAALSQTTQVIVAGSLAWIIGTGIKEVGLFFRTLLEIQNMPKNETKRNIR